VTTPTGDPAAFAAALADLIEQFANGRPTTLRLERRALSWSDFDAGVADYLKTFSFGAFARRIAAGIERLGLTGTGRLTGVVSRSTGGA
jgi:hypothetical protein